MLILFAILWRHNGIFGVFPAFFVLSYIFLKDRKLNSKAFLKNYTSLIFLSAILCIIVAIFVPKILTKGNSYPANHIFLHQIAGACVPANDSSCFKDEWYLKGKKFEDVKIVYEKYPLAADPLGVPWIVPWAPDVEQVFQYGKLNGLYKQWIKAIFKHPYNYFKHELQFIKATWQLRPFMKDTDSLSVSSEKDDYFDDMLVAFPKNEWSINFSVNKREIYTFLYDHKIILHTTIAVSASFVLMMIRIVLLGVCKYHKFGNTFLVFVFAINFSSFWFAFFLAIFSPIPGSHYIIPILPLSLMALLGFVAFVLDYLAHKRLKAI